MISDNDPSDSVNISSNDSSNILNEQSSSIIVSDSDQFSIRVNHQVIDNNRHIMTSQYVMNEYDDTSDVGIYASSLSSVTSQSETSSNASPKRKRDSSNKTGKQSKPRPGRKISAERKDRLNDQINSCAKRGTVTFKRNAEDIVTHLLRDDSLDTINCQFANLKIEAEFSSNDKDLTLRNESHQRQNFIADCRFHEREQMSTNALNNLPKGHHLRQPSGSSEDVKNTYSVYYRRGEDDIHGRLIDNLPPSADIEPSQMKVNPIEDQQSEELDDQVDIDQHTMINVRYRMYVRPNAL
jgi:hypothetical protein